MRRALFTLLFFGLGCLTMVGGQAMAATPEHADVRVLIDISGSMKQNDPQNLRRPALRMLVGLLQPGTRAGVWTFAKYARELVQVGPVDQVWKEAARNASDEINSPGMFTNIEVVLERAVHDWEGKEQGYRRHLLLLTDGVVDVSKQPGESEASRKRILENLLPRLSGMNVQLHAIALSARADHELLKYLAAETGGWYEQVDSAEQLQRVFLKLFEKAGKPDGLPLKDNKFLVDNTVREATILLFRKEGDTEPVLTSPSGQVVARDALPASVSWHHDTGYELITLSEPESGEWSLNTDTDPDNRVLIVTDLQLQVSEMPSRIAAGEPLPVSAHLTNSGHLITRRGFLDVVEVHAETKGIQGLAPQPLNDKGYKGDGTALDGIYSMNLVERQAQGELELVIAAESSTFLRQARHVLEVVDPAQLIVESRDGELLATLSISESVMKGDGIAIRLWQQDPEGVPEPLEGSMKPDGRYQVALAHPWPLYARVEGTTRLGAALTRQLGPVYAPGMAPKAMPAERAATEEVAPADEVAPDVADEEQNPWLMPALLFAAVNLLLVFAGLGYWWLRRRASADEEIVLIAEDEPEVEMETDMADDKEATA